MIPFSGFCMHSGETKYCSGAIALGSTQNTFGHVKWHDLGNSDHDRNAHSNASLLGSQCLRATHMQQHLCKECDTAMQTAQLDEELTTISFLAPPSSNGEGQIVDQCPPPAPYDTDIIMEGTENIDEGC